jgi:hypothetical protein
MQPMMRTSSNAPLTMSIEFLKAQTSRPAGGATDEVEFAINLKAAKPIGVTLAPRGARAGE